MCTTVFAADLTEITTVAELRAIWPTLIGHYAGVLVPMGDEDYCLCGIDIPLSARVNKARVRHDPTFDEYVITAD